MRKFIQKTIIIAFPILIILVSVNYFGDAARLFDNDYEKKMVRIINSGQYVTNIDNYDERLFQREFISNGTIQPNILIIGSSRTMSLNSDLFPDISLFNSSVSGASIEDIVSIYQLYKENDKLPNRIIIGIDPWTFNENNGQKRWQSIGSYFYQFQDSDKKKNITTAKYKELLSFSYFQSSMKLLPRLLNRSRDPEATMIKFNVTKTKLTDGSLVYDKLFRNASETEIENKVKLYISHKLYGIGNFTAISNRIWGIFQRLIVDMKKSDIEVEFFLVPYAPLVYYRVENEYPMVLKTEELIKDYARTNDIKLYGSFNPFELGMDESYFYDGMHCKEAGIEKIIQMSKSEH